jgi:hypothetical protein
MKKTGWRREAVKTPRRKGALKTLLMRGAALLFALGILMTFSPAAFAFADEGDSEDVALVRDVFDAIQGIGDIEVLYRIVDSDENIGQLANEVTLTPVFSVQDLQLTEILPGYVAYSCTLPNPAAMALDISGLGTLYAWNQSTIPLGQVGLDSTLVLDIERTPADGVFAFTTLDDGTRCIDISDGKNPISLYFRIRMNKDKPSSLKDNGRYVFESKVREAMGDIGRVVESEYARAGYESASFENDLEKATEEAVYTWANTKSNGDTGISQKTGMILGLILVLLAAIVIIIVCIVKIAGGLTKENRRERAVGKYESLLRKGSVERGKWPDRLMKLLAYVPKEGYSRDAFERMALKQMAALLAFAPKATAEYKALVAKNIDAYYGKGSMSSSESESEDEILMLSLMALSRMAIMDINRDEAKRLTAETAPTVGGGSSFWRDVVSGGGSPIPYLLAVAASGPNPAREGALLGLYPLFKKYEGDPDFEEAAISFFANGILYERRNEGFGEEKPQYGYSTEGGALEKEIKKLGLKTKEEFKKEHTRLEKKRDNTFELTSYGESLWFDELEEDHTVCSFQDILLCGAVESGDKLLVWEKGEDPIEQYKRIISGVEKGESEGEDPGEKYNLLHRLISLFFSPIYDSSVITWIKHNLEGSLQKCSEPSSDVHSTIAGWAAAALGRCIAADPDVGKIKKELTSDLVNEVTEEYNDIVERLMVFQATYKDVKIKDIDAAAYREYEELQGKISGGFLVTCMRKGIHPIFYLTKLATDNQNTYGDRFVTQGAIMGLLPFLLKNKGDDAFAEIFKGLVETRSQLISTDNKCSFFEVRVPGNVTPKEYGAILREVLNCANPSLSYADIQKTMEVAIKEIPGVMDLLTKYPLRLIDPSNKDTDGFYEFTPFEHQMWVSYTPPINTGQVNRRFHEVIDLTIPNSLGLRLTLFTDTYSVIPTLFHEHCHYNFDHNEANVFLRTYLFSQRLYAEYAGASPMSDYTFLAMEKLLGDKVSYKDTEELNALIERYYGKQIPRTEAEFIANQYIETTNSQIAYINSLETWCPEVPMPLLLKEKPAEGRYAMTMLVDMDGNAEEKIEIDATSYTEILEIQIRWATMRKTITRYEFNAAALQYA